MDDLNSRSTLSKLCVAYLSDASEGGYKLVFPESTLSRFLSDDVHPYRAMWKKINNFYLSMKWDTLCDQSLESKLNSYGENGFTNNEGKFISGEEIKKSVNRWRDYGWFDYEMKRDKKIKNYGKYALPPLLLLTFSL